VQAPEAGSGGRAGAAVERIVERCDTAFDGLALVPPDAAPTLGERVDLLAGVVVQRARHFAQLVYPPNDLGPTAAFGPFPIGVRTLELVDSTRMNTTGTGPRPVTVEVYYPSTAAAIAGVPKDVVKVLGVDVAATPAFRDVARADGTFPLVLFSHGNGGIRFQSFFFAAHLASHGFVVATADHHGNTFVDGLLGIVDAASATNRPLDMSFLIDRFEAFNSETGNFFAGAIDPERIGMSGHSFGGYTSFALAGGSFVLGTFTDPRVKAIFPQAPAAPFDAGFFATITVPTLIVGGSIDETTPFEGDQRRPFDLMPSGAAVVGLARLADAGHFTFSYFCEVPRALLGFLGGFDEACEPRHLPWRYAHDIVNYLSLNFFDAVLNGDAAALDRLSPANLARFEDLVYQSK
jgi:predicted dienelactone hydrolase